MCNICICITNPMRTNERGRLLREWIELPFSEEERQEVFTSLGSEDEYGDYFISDVETYGFDIDIDYTTDIDELNALVKKIDALPCFEDYKLAAYLEWVPHLTLEEISAIIDDLEQYDFISDICDHKEFEAYCIRQYGAYEAIPERLQYILAVEKNGGSFEFIRHTSIGTIIKK